jgi:uncharacterized membrane protein YdcZ (DUF606 family)
MTLSAYLTIAAGLAIVPVLVFAVTMLHSRARRLSTLVAAVGAWIAFVGSLGTVFLISSADSAQAHVNVALADNFNLYFTISGVVSYVGLAVFALGLLWFAFQHPRSGASGAASNNSLESRRSTSAAQLNR